MESISTMTPRQAWQALVGSEAQPAVEWTMDGLRAHVEGHALCADLDDAERAQLLNLLAAHLRAELASEIQGLYAGASWDWRGTGWTGPATSDEPDRAAEPHASELVALAKEAQSCVFRSEHWEIDADGLQGDETLEELVALAVWRGDPASKPHSKALAEFTARSFQLALDVVKGALAAEAFAAQALGAVRFGRPARARELASLCLAQSVPGGDAPSWQRFAVAVDAWASTVPGGESGVWVGVLDGEPRIVLTGEQRPSDEEIAGACEVAGYAPPEATAWRMDANGQAWAALESLASAQ